MSDQRSPLVSDPDSTFDTPQVSSVNCPSQSVYTVTQHALKPGSYKIVATPFVPETGDQAQAEYPFTVVPSS